MTLLGSVLAIRVGATPASPGPRVGGGGYENHEGTRRRARQASPLRLRRRWYDGRPVGATPASPEPPICGCWLHDAHRGTGDAGVAPTGHSAAVPTARRSTRRPRPSPA